jgi:hypothetical protein
VVKGRDHGSPGRAERGLDLGRAGDGALEDLLDHQFGDGWVSAARHSVMKSSRFSMGSPLPARR